MRLSKQTVVLMLALSMLLAGISVSWAKKPKANRQLEMIPNEIEPSHRLPYMRVSDESGAALALYNLNYAVEPASPEAMARQYLRENYRVLKMQPELNDLVYTSTRETPGGLHVRFLQHVQGYPVYKGDIVVNLNHSHAVTLVMSGYKPLAHLENARATVSLEQAYQSARDYLGIRGGLNFEKRETIVYYNQDETRLAHRIVLVPREEQYGDWEVLVDAQTGEIFRVEDKALYAGEEQRTPTSGSGWVFDPDPLTHARANYQSGGQFGDNNDADTDSLVAHIVERSLPDIDFDGSQYHLNGPYAHIVDIEDPFFGLFSRSDSLWHATRFPADFEAANVYFHLDQSMRYINETLNFPLMPFQYSGGVQGDPHGLSGSDNSHYIPSSGQLAWGEGGVDDSEDADVILHELGHGLHDWLTNGNLSQVDGLSEGSGDYWANSYNRSTGHWTPADPQYFWVFQWDGHNEFWPGRVTNYSAHYPEGLVGQIHTDGQIWASTLMQIYEDIGREACDANFLEALSMTNGNTNQEDAAQAFLQADLNLHGGMHLTQIFFWFDQRGYNVTIPADPLAPIAPADFSAYSDFNTPTSITLTWVDPTQLVNGTPISPSDFQIMIERDGVMMDSVAGGTGTYVDANLNDGQFYSYRITAKLFSDGRSSLPAEAGWHAGGSPIPAAPANLDCDASNLVDVTLTWEDPTTQEDGTPLDDLDSIRVYRDGQLIASLAPGVQSYTDAPAPGIIYAYHVTAIDNETPVNESAPSNVVNCFVGAPVAVINPDSFSFTLNSGDTDSLTLTITNNGASDLIFDLRDEDVTKRGSDRSVDERRGYQTRLGIDFPKGELDDRQGLSPIEGSGGPDNFGYRWIDSDEPGGPTFNWVDITGTGTQVSLSDDDFAEVTLPFTFSFYGVDKSAVKISSNGYLTFGADGTDFSNDPIGDPNDPNDIICPFWDDLNPTTGGSIHYLATANELIVQYTGIQHFGGSAPYTFQVSIRADGSMLFQYLDMQGDVTSATVGIENSDASDGLEVVFNAPYVHNNLAVRIASESAWLSTNPSSGTVLAGGSMDVQIIADASSLTDGDYLARVIMSSNDPAHPEIIIPVSLRVGIINAIGDDGAHIREFALEANYPNPFNPSTTISYQLPNATQVKLSVYNVLGQKVRTLVSERMEAGRYTAVWDGRNEVGTPVASGVYLYRLEAGEFKQIRKMILLK